MELIALLWNQANDPLMCWAWHSKTTVFMSSEWLVQRMIRRSLLEKTLHRSKCLKCNVICGKFIVCSVDDSIQCALLCAVCSMYVHIKECAHLCRNVHICEQCALHMHVRMWMCSARMCSPLCSEGKVWRRRSDVWRRPSAAAAAAKQNATRSQRFSIIFWRQEWYIFVCVSDGDNCKAMHGPKWYQLWSCRRWRY